MKRGLSGFELAIIAGTLLLLAVFVGVGWVVSEPYRIKKRVKGVEADLRKAATALMAKFVDDCSSLNPDPGNYLPSELTTPIAYLKVLPVDPFSPEGETFRYFNQPTRANGTYYLLVSRGPDLDWDVDRLPKKTKIPPTLLLPIGTRVKVKHKAKLTTVTSTWWIDEVEYYFTADGNRVDPPKIDLTILPTETPNRGWFSKPLLIEYLAGNNIAIYDPTNGAESDGDVLRHSQ